VSAKRVLLTGASTGIGNATLRRLVAAGHDVTTLDVKGAPEGSSRHFLCDLSDPASIDAVVEQLDGPYDALGNIAGVAGSMGAELVLRVNVYGLRHLTERLVATGRIAEGGSIVNIASLAAMAWQRHLDRIAALDAAADFAAGVDVARAYEGGGPAAYVLSKEWVVAYTQRLAGQLLPQRIRVNSVSPGPVLTPLFPYFEADAGAEQMAWMNEQVGRAAEPGDEADAIVWLAVGDSSWVNGVDLPVDGGLSAGMRVGWADTKSSPASIARRRQT
jgi:NAD(P)-dependent dehydrogenase (short-subunit alcohol dehydrogenase family)